MPKGFVYILECADGTYYTGSTLDYEKRLTEHHNGNGANHTRKRLPVKLVYLEEHQRIDDAFKREKQIQKWTRTKKEALIDGRYEALNNLAECKNESHYKNKTSASLSHQKTKSTGHKLDFIIDKQDFDRKRKNQPNKLEAERSRSRIINSENIKKFSSNGKLLLTGEYVVLDGAKALALPTAFGQKLIVEKTENNFIYWRSYDEKNNIWFQDKYTIQNLLSHTIKKDDAVSKRLIEILQSAHRLNPDFLKFSKGFDVITMQDFNRKWGLGTSSTLINNIANWANVKPYKLLEMTFGGSGYDIACAQSDKAIIYQLNAKKPEVKTVDFNPDFKNCIYFVYLNQKQNSRDGISKYRNSKAESGTIITEISEITERIISCSNLYEFKVLIEQHEQIISKLISQTPVKKKVFSDFDGSVKSLGAWGGDFVMAVSERNPSDYFKSKGFEILFTYTDMIKA